MSSASDYGEESTDYGGSDDDDNDEIMSSSQSDNSQPEPRSLDPPPEQMNLREVGRHVSYVPLRRHQFNQDHPSNRRHLPGGILRVHYTDKADEEIKLTQNKQQIVCQGMNLTAICGHREVKGLGKVGYIHLKKQQFKSNFDEEYKKQFNQIIAQAEHRQEEYIKAESFYDKLNTRLKFTQENHPNKLEELRKERDFNCEILRHHRLRMAQLQELDKLGISYRVKTTIRQVTILAGMMSEPEFLSHPISWLPNMTTVPASTVTEDWEDKFEQIQTHELLPLISRISTIPIPQQPKKQSSPRLIRCSPVEVKLTDPSASAELPLQQDEVPIPLRAQPRVDIDENKHSNRPQNHRSSTNSSALVTSRSRERKVPVTPVVSATAAASSRGPTGGPGGPGQGLREREARERERRSESCESRELREASKATLRRARGNTHRSESRSTRFGNGNSTRIRIQSRARSSTGRVNRVQALGTRVSAASGSVRPRDHSHEQSNSCEEPPKLRRRKSSNSEKPSSESVNIYGSE